jgi:hypothetical protein
LPNSIEKPAASLLEYRRAIRHRNCESEHLAVRMNTSTPGPQRMSTDVARCFLRVSNIGDGLFERVGPYEGALWRQVAYGLCTLDVVRRPRRDAGRNRGEEYRRRNSSVAASITDRPVEWIATRRPWPIPIDGGNPREQLRDIAIGLDLIRASRDLPKKCTTKIHHRNSGTWFIGFDRGKNRTAQGPPPTCHELNS